MRGTFAPKRRNRLVRSTTRARLWVDSLEDRLPPGDLLLGLLGVLPPVASPGNAPAVVTRGNSAENQEPERLDGGSLHPPAANIALLPDTLLGEAVGATDWLETPWLATQTPAGPIRSPVSGQRPVQESGDLRILALAPATAPLSGSSVLPEGVSAPVPA